MQLNASLRYHYKEDPALLTPREWAKRVAELEFVRQSEADSSRKFINELFKPPK